MPMIPHPIWKLYRWETLVRKCPYSETYLLLVKQGQKPATSRFRSKCAQALGRPEAELFSP